MQKEERDIKEVQDSCYLGSMVVATGGMERN